MKSYKNRNEAKIMLEWYNGRTVRNAKGEAEIVDAGYIGKLMNEAVALKDASNLGERFKGRTFGNFDKSKDLNAYNQCVNYSKWDLFHIGKNGILILGKVGSGKTHLAGAISNALIDRGIPVLFGTFSEHLEHIRQEFNSNSERTYLAKMKTIPVLVLDDLSREKQTDWTRQILFDVVNYRYEHMTPIIITANLNIDALGNYLGADVFSRLYEMSVMVETKGDNHRW